MARYLLDTNICIYIAKRKPPEVLMDGVSFRPAADWLVPSQ
jgi:predicted nucleic acid-binding protein